MHSNYTFLMIMFALFMIKCVHGFIGPSNLTAIQIATNTLNSVRELKGILTEQREFNEEFERLYDDVNSQIYKADRTALWLEDIQSIKGMDAENLDDFNMIISRLKNESNDLRAAMLEAYRAREEAKASKDYSKRERRKSHKRLSMYSSELKGKMSPTRAQVETAKNTKDTTVEIARLNAKTDNLSAQVSQLVIDAQNKEARRTNELLKRKKGYGQLKKGVLTKNDVRVRK